MAIIPQRWLFSWENVDACSDLIRLKFVLETLSPYDEPLMRKLEKRRGRGRNDYPIRPLWNSLLAGIIYQHPSIASLRRELLRNGELREMCGFNPADGANAVPPDWVYTRFMKLLFRCQDEIDAMFDGLVEEIRQYLPDLGEYLALDSKAIDGRANGIKLRRQSRAHSGIACHLG